MWVISLDLLDRREYIHNGRSLFTSMKRRGESEVGTQNVIVTIVKLSETSLKLGVSACLLGEEVRYDGTHKKHRYITNVMAKQFQFVPVCPEVELGMGVPREAVDLWGIPNAPRMVQSHTGEDWTVRMNKYATKRVRQSDLSCLRGYIFKNDSPSCGLERVKLLSGRGQTKRKGRGLFAIALTLRFPYLPVIEAERFDDSRLRENFIIRVCAYDRLQKLLKGRFTRSRLLRFHAKEKSLLVTHNPKRYRLLENLVDTAGNHTSSELRRKYSMLFMEALKSTGTGSTN